MAEHSQQQAISFGVVVVVVGALIAVITGNEELTGTILLIAIIGGGFLGWASKHKSE